MGIRAEWPESFIECSSCRIVYLFLWFASPFLSQFSSFLISFVPISSVLLFLFAQLFPSLLGLIIAISGSRGFSGLVVCPPTIFDIQLSFYCMWLFRCDILSSYILYNFFLCQTHIVHLWSSSFPLSFFISFNLLLKRQICLILLSFVWCKSNKVTVSKHSRLIKTRCKHHVLCTCDKIRCLSFKILLWQYFPFWVTYYTRQHIYFFY